MERRMNGERKCIMAIGGHVGDAELTSGGYLATMALKGYRIVTIALTGGERGNPPDRLCDTIRQYRPAALLTHWKNSMHKDHETTHRIVRDAQFFAGLSGLQRENSAHFAKGPYYAENWEDSAGFEKYIYLEVSKEGFELWKKAIDTHWFAVHSPSFPYKEYYEHLMRVNGCLARTGYAEAFDVDQEQKKVILSEL